MLFTVMDWQWGLAICMICLITQTLCSLKNIIQLVKKQEQSLSLHSLPSDPLRVPSLMVDRVTDSAVKYQVQRSDAITDAVITGYEVIRFGVPMIGKYVNTGRGKGVTVSPAVPGAQYRITAWALIGNGRRSETSAVESVTIGEASEAYVYIHSHVKSI